MLCVKALLAAGAEVEHAAKVPFYHFTSNPLSLRCRIMHPIVLLVSCLYPFGHSPLCVFAIFSCVSYSRVLLTRGPRTHIRLPFLLHSPLRICLHCASAAHYVCARCRMVGPPSLQQLKTATCPVCRLCSQRVQTLAKQIR